MANPKTKKFIQAKGRRKTAVARIRLTAGLGEITVNKLKGEAYFVDIPGGSQKIRALLKKANLVNKVDLSFRVSGGGKKAQLDAAIHALARALLQKNPAIKKTLRSEGYLTRDPRMKERKKYGLKGARRAPQWAKR
ncbi:MAG: ribosomal protein S9 [Candidatus Berkelbacteria bacterium Licking1014_96]|uniref:30S ribosomal protein S9 n=1 Tax=Candidatus Berkelbacteria bacterium Licking1014_96 TaxID=2017149 RepID=A0A554LCV2_9BACT|nr:MAG: ribosomal protein S9 [Candidatus Berkelbacteria bacterium Licking1014_96]